MPKPAIAHQYIEASTPNAGDSSPTVIDIRDTDCLQAAQTLLELAPGEVCVLNMANPLYVGGEYLTTQGSQEESLIERTDLLDSLTQLKDGIQRGDVAHPYFYNISGRWNFFPRRDDGLGEFTCLYSEGVAVHCVTDPRTALEDVSVPVSNEAVDDQGSDDAEMKNMVLETMEAAGCVTAPHTALEDVSVPVIGATVDDQGSHDEDMRNMVLETVDAPGHAKKGLFQINVISSAAYNLTTTPETSRFNNDLYWAGTLLKILNQLRTARHYGQRRLVLGAFGCGAFHNDPNLIASWYHAILHELEFQGSFDYVCFAIKGLPSGHPNSNYEAFKNAFCKFPTLLRDLLKQIEPPQHNGLKLSALLAPLTEVRSIKQLHFVAKRILQEEVNLVSAKPHTSEQRSVSPTQASQQKKFYFLKEILNYLNEYPQHARSILTSVFAGNSYQRHQSVGRLFKTAILPVSLRKLRTVLTEAESNLEEAWETLNPTQATLAQEGFEHYVLARTVELLKNCEADADAQVSCFLLYIAATQSREFLLESLQERYTDLPQVHKLLLAIHELCSGSSAHPICVTIADRRFFCGAATDLAQWKIEVAASLGRYVAFRLRLFLKLGYMHYFEDNAFENFLQAAADLDSGSDSSSEPEPFSDESGSHCTQDIKKIRIH